MLQLLHLLVCLGTLDSVGGAWLVGVEPCGCNGLTLGELCLLLNLLVGSRSCVRVRNLGYAYAVARPVGGEVDV